MSKKYFKEILNHKEISLHWFRHTFITRCIKKGIPIHKISYFVRHNDIKQTLAYMGDEDKEFNNEERLKMGLI
jgi:site-specific recombinase XerD